MTLLGKILVLMNLAFAVLLAGWSFTMYKNGIDWTDHKEGSVPSGEFALHEAKLDEMWRSVPLAQTNWQAGRNVLQNAEKSHAAERVWYDKEMRHVFAGPAGANPVGEVVLADKDDPKSGVRKGQILIDNKGLPMLAPLKDRAGNPLLSLAEYNDKDKKVLQDLDEVMAKHEKQIAEASKLTDLIIGDKAAGKRGLQERIQDELAKDAGVVAEQKLVEPLRINTLVDAELILKRKNQLERRVDELKKAKVARK